MSFGKPSGAGFALVLSGAARLFCALIFFTTVQLSGAATRPWDDNDKDADWSIWDLGNAPTNSASSDLIFSETNDTGAAVTPVNQDLAPTFQLNNVAFRSGGRFFLANGDTAVSGVGTTMRNSTGTDAITATPTWSGAGANNNWSNGVNWGGTAPVANDSLSFGGTIQLATNNDIAANTIFAGITFNSLAGAFTLSGNNITLGGDVINNSTSLQTISLAMILSATRTFTTLAGGGDLSIGGILSGAGGLTKTGTGTLTLSGANTYNGATSISAGVLNIQNATSLGATGTGTTVSSGATLQLQGSITVGNEALTISGIGASGQTGALVNVSGTNNYGGLLTLAAATTLSSDSGMLNLTNNGTITGATFGLTLAGAGDGSILSIIGTTSGSLTKTGTGTWSLLGANTYTGATTVSAGVLNIQNATGLGTTAAGTTVSSGATLQLQGGITLGAETLNINGTGASGQTGALVNVSGTNTYGGLLTLAGASTLSSDSGILNLTNAGTITGATFGLTLAGAGNGSISSIIGTTTGSLTKNGAGTWSLLGVNTYSGGTTINGGTLVVNSLSSMGAITGGLAINAGTLEVTTSFTTTRAITLGDAASTFQIDASQTFTDSTAIGGAGNLNKTGLGTMFLGGANTYAGATAITAGILNIQDATGLGTIAGGTTISSGATLQLQGNISVGNEALTISGLGASGQNGALVNVSGTNNYGGLLTLAGATTLSSDSGTLNLTNAGTITGATFGLTLAGAGNGSISSIIGTTSGSLIKNGAGTWSLFGVNTYTGGTTINGGTLVVNSASSMGNLSGGLTINAGTLEVSTGFSTTRAITLGNAASTFQIDASRIFTDTTAIGGTGGLNKTGAGTMVLGGANTYAGATTITTGVLNIQNATALGTIVGDTTVSNGAALQIQGGITIGAEVLTLNGNGIANDGALRNISSANSMSGAITLGSATTISSDTGTLTLSGAFDNGGFLLTVGGAGDVTTSGVISGLGGLTKTGSGTLTLSGTGNNTYSGLTTVNDGTLQLNMTPAKNASAGNFTVGDGTGAASSAVMRWLGSNQIPNKALTINTDGLADLNNFSDTIGALTVTGGRVTVGTGTLTLNNSALTMTGGSITTTGVGMFILGGNVTGNASASSATISGNLALGNNRTFTIADGAAAVDMNISAIVSGGFSLTKADTGTLVLSGANTYTGATTVSAGVLNIQNGFGLGTTGTGTTVSSGATLQLEGGITIGTETLSVNGAGANLQTGAVVNVGGTNNYGGLLTLAGATTLSSDSGTLNLTNTGTIGGNNFALTLAGAGNGSISSIIGTTGGSLTKNGVGTWSLLGVNTYTGGTTINGGTLVVNSASSLGNLSGGLTINAGTLEVSAGFTTTRAITLGNVASTFQIDTSQTFTDSTAISGTGSLNKTGAGTMVLGATETYTGSTNVTAGTLQINASNRIVDTSALTVSGGNFDVQAFSETVAAVTLSGGSITGTGAGTLTGSSYALQNGSASAILAGGGAVNKTTTGTVTLTGANTLTGAVTVSGGTLTLAATSGSALGAVASIAVNSGGTLLLGASNQINNAATMSLGGGTFASGGFSEGSANNSGLSTLGVGALTLTAANSHLDFGTGAVGTLSFASLTAGGFTLTIDNWTGTLATIGGAGTDRLIFNSNQSGNLNSFQFTGYGPGAVEFNLGGGFWEITPAVVAPEPATYFTAALTFAAACFHQRRRIRELFLRRIAT